RACPRVAAWMPPPARASSPVAGPRARARRCCRWGRGRRARPAVLPLPHARGRTSAGDRRPRGGRTPPRSARTGPRRAGPFGRRAAVRRRHNLVAPGFKRERVVAALVGPRLGPMTGVIGRAHGPDPRSGRTRGTRTLDGTGRTRGHGAEDPGRARWPRRPAARDECEQEAGCRDPAHVPGTRPDVPPVPGQPPYAEGL